MRVQLRLTKRNRARENRCGSDSKVTLAAHAFVDKYQRMRERKCCCDRTIRRETIHASKRECSLGVKRSQAVRVHGREKSRLVACMRVQRLSTQRRMNRLRAIRKRAFDPSREFAHFSGSA